MGQQELHHDHPLSECVERLAKIEAGSAAINAMVLSQEYSQRELFSRVGKMEVDLACIQEFTMSLREQMPPLIDKINKANGSVPHIREDINEIKQSTNMMRSEIEHLNVRVSKYVGGAIAVFSVIQIIVYFFGPIAIRWLS